MSTRILSSSLLVICAFALAACSDDAVTIDPLTTVASNRAAAPAGVINVAIGPEQAAFWPFTGTDLSGNAQDPINLVFRGKADARALRSALMALDGNRQAFGMPDVFPFNCTWSDAYGDPQSSYESESGWNASMIQLECGSYGPIRFHLRLFPAGDITLANAHFEILVPGTADHQVISWELAEQLVVADFMRTGLLDPAMPVVPTTQINPAPGHRSILAVLYNGLPVELRAAIGGPIANVTADVPIGNDGSASVLTLAAAAPIRAGSTNESLTLEYNQVIPRPFCAAGPADYIMVQGPVTLVQRHSQRADGALTSSLRARGTLTVTPVNPLTGEMGAPRTADIADSHELALTGSTSVVDSRVGRTERLADGQIKSSLLTRFELAGNGREQFTGGPVCN